MKGFPRVHPLIFVGLTMLVGAGLAPRTAAAENYVPLTVTCAGARVTMSCKPHSGCSETLTRMTTANGRNVVLEKPKGLNDYTGVGLACTVAPDKRVFLQVEYGALPYGCTVCEWEALYDLTGKRLTDNDPAILIDKERAAFDGGEYPNNEQFYTLAKKWHLNHPDIHGINDASR